MAEVSFTVKTSFRLEPYVARYAVADGDVMRLIAAYGAYYGPVMDETLIPPAERARTPGEILLEVVNGLMAGVMTNVANLEQTRLVAPPAITLVANS